MESRKAGFLEVMGAEGVQFIVPVFQRVYSWTEQQCADLLDDVMRAGTTGKPHFSGVFLYLPDTDNWDGYLRLQVIDGQQRLTTVTLMIIALMTRLRTSGERSAGEVPGVHELARRFLFAGEKGASVKLVLTSIDADMLEYLIGAAEKPDDEAGRLLANYEYFLRRMESPGFDVEAFWRGLNALEVIAVELSGADSAQAVFESLNSKGKRLSIEDLMRNALLAQDARGDDALRTYRTQWLPLEARLDAVEDFDMTDLVTCWLMGKHRDERITSHDEVYALFGKQLATTFGGSYESVLRTLSAFADKVLRDIPALRQLQRESEKWLSGKPGKIISDYRLFGD